MVVAGPGTGKTHVLTLRIANILKQTDIAPHNILALTFTDSAAKNMRSRLITLIGQTGYGVRIETFHALSDSIIREYPEFFPFERDALPLTQLEQREIIRSFLESPKLKFLRTPGSKYHYVRDIVSSISTLKREGITPKGLAKVVADEKSWFENEKDSLKKTELLKWEPLTGKHLELVGIYEGYQKQLASKARYDFDDMLLETYKALQENPLLLASLQEQFQYILVDEYQDTNGVQNAIVNLLASFWEEPNLFVVGDPNQTIFRFQGALLENTLGFLDHYPKAVLISLSQGYRSNQIVYNTAYDVVIPTLKDFSHPVTKGLKQALEASHNRGTIVLEKVETDEDELLLIVKNVQSLLAAGTDPNEIAVLYKRNSEGGLLSDLFSRANLPFHTQQETNALTVLEVQQFLNLIRLLHCLVTGSEQRLLFDVMSYPWFSLTQTLTALNRLQLMRSFALQKKISTPLEYIALSQPDLAKTLVTWVSQEKSHTFPAFIELLAHESGFFNFLTSLGHQQTLQSYTALFKEIGRLTQGKRNFDLDSFIAYLTTMESEGLTLPVAGANQENGVTLSTVHKAKGREWEHVFVPFLREGYWGKSRRKSGFQLPEGITKHGRVLDPNEEERRLLFVALTRTKKTLHLSYSESKKDSGRTTPVLPSPYLLELSVPPATPIEIEDSLKTLFISPLAKIDVDIKTRSWLSSLIESFALSASSLNTYLEDPKKFFERYILKLPEATRPHLAFGNAVHGTLEWYFKTYKENDNTHLPSTKALPIFDRQLSSFILSPEDAISRQEQGHRVLTEYLTQQAANFPQILAIEEYFGWRRGKIILQDIELTGKIDRIDLLDTEEKSLRVIDYKTGKSKSLGDIEGKTKASELSERELSLPEPIRGRLKRQLLFYKLLLSIDPKYKSFKVNEGVFEFVEPDKGKFISRQVALLDEDVEILKDLIKTVSQEIRALKFLDNI